MKKIVCRCHDVTEEDIMSAIDSGYDDLETLKRFTGATTGHCQGKTCMTLLMNILSQKTGKPVNQTTRIRPPIDPIMYEFFLQETKEES